ncbi:glycosyltransferase [Microvirga sp. BT291]|nr:glycosyltransferase [Microvirga pudoricolor]
MVSTEAGSGGAARAMQRLAQGLRGRGHEVDVFIAVEAGASANEVLVRPRADETGLDRFARVASTAFDASYVAARRSSVSNTSFSTQVTGLDLAAIPGLRGFDAVNVHWTGGMMSPLTLGNVADLGIPTVFTLHDMAHFTGGCHYAAGCRGFEAACEPCHQVHPDELGLIRHSLETKRERYGRPNARAVSPSAWLAGLADASRVFSGPVQVIPNGLETETFRPRDRAAVRQSLGLASGDCAILFGVYDNREHRKGFEDLLGALRLSLRDAAFAERAGQGRIHLLSFGKTQADLAGLGLPVIDLGWVDSDERLSEIYNAADLCVLPSHEDNQPNVMVEAMACGTPVIAFRVGGIPETVTDGRNGRLVEPLSLDDLARAIVDLALDEEAAKALGRSAAEDVQRLTLDRQAEAYEALFESLAVTVGWRPSDGKQAGIGAGDGGLRQAYVPLRLDPYVETRPFGPILAEQVEALAQELTAVKTNRDELHDQLLSVTGELVSVTANRDGLYEQLVAVNEHSAARDAELALLKGKLVNRILLKLRDRLKRR